MQHDSSIVGARRHQRLRLFFGYGYAPACY